MNVIKPIDGLIVGPAELEARLFAARRPLPALPVRLLMTARIWWIRYRERQRMLRDLPTFTAEVLEDFGLTREQAEVLARKPFWQA